MEPSAIERIEAVTEKELEWETDGLFFKVSANDRSFDIIPHLGEGLKCQISPTFVHPANATIGNLVQMFKIQAAEQGTHLTCVGSCKNPDSKSGIFFRLACDRHRLSEKKQKG